jgi:adenylyltransferase/sulfurtransferase
VPSCAEGGVLGVVCAAIGSVMATEAVKLICGIGEPLLGRLTIFDALAMSWRTIRVRPAADRQPVRELLADYDAFCSLPTIPVVDGESSDTITAPELAERLRRRERGEDKFVLVDVREPGEWEIVRIPGAVLLPLDRLRDGRAAAELSALTSGGQVVLHCKSGGRSAQALQLARAAGFVDAVHLEGGVLAWVDQVDPGQPRY